MENDSFNNRSAGVILCGIFSILLIFSLIAYPNDRISKDTRPFLKESRPYKAEITGNLTKKYVKRLRTSKREHIYNHIIIEAATKYGIEPALLKAIIMAESSYNHMAISEKGAVGLMQLMPRTADALGVEDIYDPQHNVNGGAKYFKQLLNKFNGNLELALAAYNAGTTKVRKYNGIPPFSSTRIYIKKVFEYYRHYQLADQEQA
ncbi:lytic transglycosylase domain-containing protein [Thermodesulfobacteriota bacterium]